MGRTGAPRNEVYVVMKSAALALLVAFGTGGSALAGQADVVGAVVDQRSRGIYDFDVMVRSHDTGWEAYADRIEVLGPDGGVLGTRVLEHPHEQEQPFTRDVHGVVIPPGIVSVTIRAHHKTAGYDGAVLTVSLRGK